MEGDASRVRADSRTYRGGRGTRMEEDASGVGADSRTYRGGEEHQDGGGCLTGKGRLKDLGGGAPGWRGMPHR